MAATSQDEFVDLYEVLELATDAESETIRKRLNELYLEAQQNLDHRNVKKRLQYQQMYEIYLPQARHLLLDPRRRAEYDRYLAAYRTGNKVAPSEQTAEEQAAPPAELSKIDEPPLPGMAELEVDPAVIAAQREDIWAKWKQGLELVSEDEPARPAPRPQVASAAATVSETSAVEAPEAEQTTPGGAKLPPFARRSAPPVRPGATGARPTPPAPRSPGSAPTRPTPPVRTPGIGRTPTIGATLETPEELEKQREAERLKELEKQRYAIVMDAAQHAALVWGAIWAAATFVVCCGALLLIMNRLEKYPLGLSSSNFASLCLLFILVLAAGAGVFGASKAKRRTASTLSLLPIEELLRRNRS